MDPFPIPPATVSRVLELIVDLDQPLPAALLSRPLLQRHHFLAIAIDDPAQYLAWPGSGSPDAVDLLKTFHTPPHDLSFTARYSADPECLQAHVHITNPATPRPANSNDFRLVFQWDPTHAWQYHNIALMPFPSNTYPSFSDALGIFQSTNDFLAEQSYVVSIASGDEDDDSYWNSYAHDEDSDLTSKSALAKPRTPLNSEDAYWARYSSIHGSADSTIPSPLPVKRTLEGAQGVDRVIVTSDSLQNNPTELYNPLEPPSPESLAKRLADISHRPASPPIEDEDVSTDSNTTSPAHDITVLDGTPDDSPLTASLGLDDESPAIDESDLALRQTIQGIYRLWKTEQQRKSLDSNTEAFLTVVRNAIQS